jgi:CubicO group peptidase (beta-lactamase class C family)
LHFDRNPPKMLAMGNENSQAADFAGIAQPFLDKGAFAGAVLLVADHARILSVEAVGYADVAKKTPMRPDSLGWIASQTKPITGTLAMLLIEEGKISLDDPISKYLPEFNTMWVAVEKDEQHTLLRPASRPITVRDVLCHVSGLPFMSAVEHPSLDGLSLAQASRSYSMMPLQTEPGTKYAYSNAGINIAGRIIEIVTGLSYEQFLDRRFLGPLGMDDTTFWPNEAMLPRVAKSYTIPDDTKVLTEIQIGQLRYPLNDPTRYPMPAGGLFSNVTDCARFCQMILRGGEWGGRRYLTEQSVATLVGRHTPTTINEDYGLGWSRSNGGYGHGGAFNTVMWIDPHLNLINVFFIQHAGNGEEIKKCYDAGMAVLRKRFGKSPANR